MAREGRVVVSISSCSWDASTQRRGTSNNCRDKQNNVETKKLAAKKLFSPARSTFLFVCQTMEHLLRFTEKFGECLDTAASLLMLPEGSIVALPACGNNGAAKIVSAFFDPPGITLAPADTKKSAFTAKWANQVVIELEDLGNIRVVTDTSDSKPQEEMDVHGKVLALAKEQIDHIEARPWKLGSGVESCLHEGGGWLKISTGQKKVERGKVGKIIPGVTGRIRGAFVCRGTHGIGKGRALFAARALKSGEKNQVPPYENIPTSHRRL